MSSESKLQFEEVQSASKPLGNGETFNGSANLASMMNSSKKQNFEKVCDGREENSNRKIPRPMLPSSPIVIPEESDTITPNSMYESNVRWKLSRFVRRRCSKARKRCFNEVFGVETPLCEENAVKKKFKLADGLEKDSNDSFLNTTCFSVSDSKLPELDIDEKTSSAETGIKWPEELRGNLTVGTTDGNSPTEWAERCCVLKDDELRQFYPEDERCTDALCVMSLKDLNFFAKLTDFTTMTQSLFLRFKLGNEIKVVYLCAKKNSDLLIWEDQINLIQDYIKLKIGRNKEYEGYN
ncbi:hypothetical protein GWI33_000617 [Rhynchophorus ferrugineus]|uniref:Uncharacterized protein n=1 Tax=Rhynchophorus ferrugineus TaxID=354439 RepID=A0A834HL19_RHYFE|nr:hypothetical protein GWI33_000617 [Rhynchophorus ferrugineus]